MLLSELQALDKAWHVWLCIWFEFNVELSMWIDSKSTIKYFSELTQNLFYISFLLYV